MADPAVPGWVPDFPPVRSARIISVKAQDAARAWEQPVTPGELLTIGKDLGSALGNTGAALSRLSVYHAAYQAPADQWFRLYDHPDEPNIFIECAARALDCAGRDMAFALSDHITRSGQPVFARAVSGGAARRGDADGLRHHRAPVRLRRGQGRSGKRVHGGGQRPGRRRGEPRCSRISADVGDPGTAAGPAGAGPHRAARIPRRLRRRQGRLRRPRRRAEHARAAPDPVAPVAARAGRSPAAPPRRSPPRPSPSRPSGQPARPRASPPRRLPSPAPRAGAAARHVRGAAVTGPGNADRAAWAAQAIEAFQSAAGHHAGLDTAEAIGEPDHRAVPLRRPARHQLRHDPDRQQRCVPVPARQ